jgi:hypothetical protein
VPGTRRDAVLHSVGANATHGYPRSNADKVNAVMTLLRDPKWSQWSNVEIADRCNVSDEMVRQRRASLPTVGSERRYTNKHGTVTTMKTEAIGRHCVVAGKKVAALRQRTTAEIRSCWRSSRPCRPTNKAPLWCPTSLISSPDAAQRIRSPLIA